MSVNFSSVRVSSEPECMVCFDLIDASAKPVLGHSCGDSEAMHVFHADCIRRALEADPRCPLCRLPAMIEGEALPESVQDATFGTSRVFGSVLNDIMRVLRDIDERMVAAAASGQIEEVGTLLAEEFISPHALGVAAIRAALQGHFEVVRMLIDTREISEEDLGMLERFRPQIGRENNL